MTADPGDTLLVLRAQAGNIEAFDGLFQRYAPMLLKHLQYVLRDDSLAEDVLQDTLILMYRKLSHGVAQRPHIRRECVTASAGFGPAL